MRLHFDDGEHRLREAAAEGFESSLRPPLPGRL
jgi:hypothetical protein